MTSRRWMLGMLGMVSAAALVTALSGWLNPARVHAADEGTQTLEGKAAPDFSLDTVDGKTVKLSDLKGNVVVLDFWATWCGPCRKSLPHVQEMSANKDLSEKGLRVWTVNVKEDKAKAEAFLKTNKYTFNVALDKEGSASDAYKIEGIPTTVVVGRDGTVKKVFVGAGPTLAKDLDAAVESALGEKVKAARAD